eukprot:1540902-Alexandrium_andersonii.AAC.1
MSASLVGSEMCIRDSPRLSAQQHPREVALPTQVRSWRCLRGRGGGGGGPVSYTHLTLPTICSV